MAQALFILGLNHRSAPVEVRERLAFGEHEVVPALSRLRGAADEIVEVALLSTCNRVELIGVGPDCGSGLDRLRRFMAEARAVDDGLFEPALYRLEGRAAVRHLFRVGCALDSMVVGEPQILGQLKIAYTQAAEAGTAGMILHRVFHKAFSVAKRVRKETLIGHGSVSVSSAAVKRAAQIFDSLADKTVMLLGAGKIAELTARHLVKQGVESLLLTNRTFDRAVAVARELGGTAVPYDNYRPYLKIVDVLIGSIATTRPLLGAEQIEPILRERKYRPMFLIDLGVPRNFDENLNDVANIYLYDIDDLASVVQDTQGERAREAEKAELIIEAELSAFWRWMEGLEIVPAIKDIRSNIERLRESELNRHRAWLASLEPGERRQIESLTRGLVNKILHQVMTELRRRNGKVEGAYAAEIARRLLGAELALAGAPLESAGLELDEDDDEDV